MIRNLGQVLSVLVAQEAAGVALHEDVDAFGAPSECHGLVEKQLARRRAEAFKKMEQLAGVPFRQIRQEAEDRGFVLYGPQFDRAVDSAVARMELPWR